MLPLPVITQLFKTCLVTCKCEHIFFFFFLWPFSPLVFLNIFALLVMLGLVLTVRVCARRPGIPENENWAGGPWGVVGGNPGNEKPGSGERRHSKSHGWVYCSDPTFGVTADRTPCFGWESFEGGVKEFKVAKWGRARGGGGEGGLAAEPSHLCVAVWEGIDAL